MSASTLGAAIRIVLPTNLNGKLACSHMLHIAAAPAQLIPESQLNKLYCFVTRDESHPERLYYLRYFIRLQVMQLNEVYTWCSHGMQAIDFKLWYMEQNGVLSDTELAVYFYEAAEV